MPVAYTSSQRDAFARALRTLVAAGVSLPDDLELLSDEVAEITSSLGGPAAFAENPPHTGLNFSYSGGRFSTLAGAPIEVAADTIALTDDATNYVECDAAGTVSKNTSGFTAGALPLFVVVTASGAITDVTDKRPFMLLLDAGSIGTNALAAGAVTGPKLATAGELAYFGRQDLPASNAGQLYTAHGVQHLVMDRPGYLMGMSAELSQALVGGSVLLEPTINGVAVSQNGLDITLDVGNPQRRYATVAWAAHAAYRFLAGDRVGVKWTTTSLNASDVIDIAALLRLRTD